MRMHEVCMQLGEQTGTKKLRKQVQTFYEFQLLTQVRFKLGVPKVSCQSKAALRKLRKVLVHTFLVLGSVLGPSPFPLRPYCLFNVLVKLFHLLFPWGHWRAGTKAAMAFKLNVELVNVDAELVLFLSIMVQILYQKGTMRGDTPLALLPVNSCCLKGRHDLCQVTATLCGDNRIGRLPAQSSVCHNPLGSAPPAPHIWSPFSLVYLTGTLPLHCLYTLLEHFLWIVTGTFPLHCLYSLL